MAKALFREIEHTADLGIEVEADTPQELFRRAGLALFSLLVSLDNVEVREERNVTTDAEGWDELLHDWLSSLLHQFLQDGFIAVSITIDDLDANRVRARLAGEKLDYDRHAFETEIKAVTYHQLAVKCEEGRWWARVIFDV